MSLKQKHKKILAGCVAVSLFLHGLSILFLQGRSLWFSSSKPAQNGQIDAPWLSYIEKMERDQILKEAFEPQAPEGTLALGRPNAKCDPQPESEPSLAIQAIPLKAVEGDSFFSFAFSPPNPLPPHKLLASNQTPARASLSAPTEAFNLAEHLPKELRLSAAPPESASSSFSPAPLSSGSEIAFNAVPLSAPQETPLSTICFSAPILRTPALTDRADPPKAPPPASFPTLPKLPTLADLETASYSESFDTELVFLQREDGQGYIFAITLIPRADLDLPRLRQHFTFLIDRSNSIQKDRLAATKSAVDKALEELAPDDTFNIIAFDSKMEKLSAVPLSRTNAALNHARNFLEKIQLGSFFSSGDLYKPLLLTVPGHVQNDELYTAILLTDGENLSKKSVQRSILFDWTAYNSGKVALFPVVMDSDAHLSTLDAAAYFNKGKLIYSPTNRGIKRKLLKLMKTISNPVAKNLNCKAISRSPASDKSKIELFPKQMEMPHLYLDQPYVILGTTDALDDFILFAQGRLKNRWINIKKTISFVNAKKGGNSLKAEWALQQAYSLYARYVLDGNPEHLAEAGKLLEPYGYQVAFK